MLGLKGHIIGSLHLHDMKCLGSYLVGHFFKLIILSVPNLSCLVLEKESLVGQVWWYIPPIPALRE